VTRPGSADRMRRLLAMVPWIATNDGPTVDEVCARFGIGRAQLLDDLAVVWLVGLPPYTPDALIDVVQEGDRVWIHYPDVFDRPQALTPEQGLALLTAGASLLALPGADHDGPLARGVRKLADVLGIDPGQALEVDLGRGRPEVMAALRAAVTDRKRVHLDYYAYGRDERTERDVDPHRLTADDGALYLLGWCHLAEAERRFRLDRIVGVEVLEDDAGPVPDHLPDDVFQPDEHDPRVVLELGPDARWVAEHYPVEEVVEVDGGGLRVTLAVSAEPWLERVLLGLGPRARVVEVRHGSPDLAGAGRRAATRILDRYRGR
jgi:predicted DNA-binding transcriptional regulator YafY